MSQPGVTDIFCNFSCQHPYKNVRVSSSECSGHFLVVVNTSDVNNVLLAVFICQWQTPDNVVTPFSGHLPFV